MMDVFRSRPVLWSTALVVIFVISTVVIYSVYKSSTSSLDEVLDEEVKITYALDTVDDDPLELDGFTRSSDWETYPAQGILSANVADFHKGTGCLRAIIFMGRGVPLVHILVECDSMEPTTWLIMDNGSLYYHRRAMIAHGPGLNTFTVAKKLFNNKKCLVADYSISWEHSPKIVSKSEVREVKGSEDEYCKSLIYFKMPPMMLLSRKGDPGDFLPGRALATINPWEPLGLVSRVYWYGIRCFRQITVTSFGRIVDAVKMTCGPVSDITLIENMFYYGNALMVRRNSSKDSFVIIYNQKKRGDCFKKTLYFEDSKLGRPLTFVKSKEDLPKEDKACLDLIRGNIRERVIDKAVVNHTETRLRLGECDVEPYGAKFKDYEPFTEWNFVNIILDLGIAVSHFSNKENLTLHKMILVVARGIPLTANLVEQGPLQRMVFREEALYYNTSIMARRINANHTYTTLFKLDEDTCFKKSFIVKHIDGMALKEEWGKEGNVTTTTDEDCMDLITGRKLKHQEFTKSGAETDVIGIPKDYLL